MNIKGAAAKDQVNFFQNTCAIFITWLILAAGWREVTRQANLSGYIRYSRITDSTIVVRKTARVAIRKVYKSPLVSDP